MAIQDSYLFPTLEAGSSRVFNVCYRTSVLLRSLEQGRDETQLNFLFKTRDLNNVVLLKEVRPSRRTSRYEHADSIGTKLYFPYNGERIYDGGKSVFLDDPQLERILQDHVGLDPHNRSEEASRDLSVIRMLDQIPSLDPFLVKDKLQIEGVEADEVYFEISAREWRAIQAHVSQKLKPIIAFAYRDSEALAGGRTTALLKKLWNTRDIDALMPIVKAFGLPGECASGIFTAWKGIMFYDYEYNRCLPCWKENLEWMQHHAAPTDFVDQRRRAELQELMEAVRAQYKDAWQRLKGIISAYHHSYDALFVRREDPGPFIDFMRHAVKTYWTIGAKMSAINHSVAVWDALTAGRFKRRLKYEQLYKLFELQREIFERS